MKGDTTDCRKREFAAVCIGVNNPKKNMGLRYHIILCGFKNFISEELNFNAYSALQGFYKPHPRIYLSFLRISRNPPR